jgi:hypothetical protein
MNKKDMATYATAAAGGFVAAGPAGAAVAVTVVAATKAGTKK